MSKIKTPYLDKAVKAIKRLGPNDDEGIKLIIAEAMGASSCSMSLVREAEEFLAESFDASEKKKG